MDEEVIKIDISSLAYDLNAILDFVWQKQNKGKTSEITEVYNKNTSGDLELVEKSLSEIKSENLDEVATIRYDLIKQLIQETNNILMEENEDGETTSPMINTLGNTLSLNTLLNEGMLISVDLKERILKKDEQE